MFCECSYPNDFFSLHLPFSSFFLLLSNCVWVMCIIEKTWIVKSTTTTTTTTIQNIQQSIECELNFQANREKNYGEQWWWQIFLVVNIVTQLFVMNRRFLCYMIMVAEPWLQLWSHHRFLFCSTAGVDLFHSNILFEV